MTPADWAGAVIPVAFVVAIWIVVFRDLKRRAK